MQNITATLSKRLGMTNKESETLIKQALKSSNPQEDLLDLLGEDSIDDIIELLALHEKQGKQERPPRIGYQVFNVEEKLDRILAPKLKRNTTEYYDEYILESPAPTAHAEKVSVDAISPRHRRIFSAHYTHFNHVQSLVFGSVYGSAENVLVCAPTGAGKTDVALLSIVRQLERKPNCTDNKIIYIAPMKALASEITEKLRHRLPCLVSEYTGDMELTREELTKSTVLVCTPEKYDVSIRKISSYLLKNTSLIIFDEIHILNDTRGPTIEAIVSRLKMSSERTQRPVRMVGISATLPNPADVAGFLGVSPRHMHVFGPGDRPVPITYSVIGTRKVVDVSANNFVRRMDKKEKMVYVLKERVERVLCEGHQVIVFVHTRGSTLSIATLLTEDIEPDEERVKEAEDAGVSGEMKELYSRGMFIHNAGLPRSIRAFAERGFREKKIKVLVSTSTLAWGVNLPARTVVVFGTEMYSAEKGGTVDVDILNIQQMFGRAGRPQYDTQAEGILITDHVALPKYVKMLRVEDPIESGLLKTLPEKLSAEIYLRNIKSQADAVRWFKTTFLYIRMCRSPVKYGILPHQLNGVISDYVLLSFERLKELSLIRQESAGGACIMTDLGRVISHYFLTESTLVEWNNQGEKACTITYLTATDEYRNIMVRSEDRKALGIYSDQEELTVEKKVQLLIEKHVQGRKIKGHSLAIDQRYILENIDRLTNGLAEYFLCKKAYEKAYQSLCLRKKVMKRAKTELIEMDLVANKHSLLFERPFTGYILVRQKKALIKIIKVDKERDCYMTHSLDQVAKVTPLSSKDIFSGRTEVIPVRAYSDHELWIVDSSLEKIAGYKIEYAGPAEDEDADMAECITRKIQFRRPERITIEEIPNAAHREAKEMTKLLVYEKIKEARSRKKDRIIIVVGSAEEESQYVQEYQKMSLIDNFSFEKDPLCMSTSNGIQAFSKLTNDLWTVGVCTVDSLKTAASKYTNITYIFSGYTKNHRIYPESVLRMLNASIVIYEKPNVADYIKQRYL
ncbi:activating signal cointegrator complex subunit 3 [Nematocida major]|uniref:activating signal cointegrator complex subunit 3 n=1 Tax=Nematocida major TaxID=1912982 RepID=UPI002008EA73|nr:activating signal cointegrator complex subunit 3 [Nematocida major]KAH9387062.1 activating signal cointegrator complex subunit 3 [Nematocida major]